MHLAELSEHIVTPWLCCQCTAHVGKVRLLISAMQGSPVLTWTGIDAVAPPESQRTLVRHLEAMMASFYRARAQALYAKVDELVPSCGAHVHMWCNTVVDVFSLSPGLHVCIALNNLNLICVVRQPCSNPSGVGLQPHDLSGARVVGNVTRLREPLRQLHPSGSADELPHGGSNLRTPDEFNGLQCAPRAQDDMGGVDHASLAACLASPGSGSAERSCPETIAAPATAGLRTGQVSHPATSSIVQPRQPAHLAPIERQASGPGPAVLNVHVHNKWADFVPYFVCMLLVWRTSVMLLDSVRSTHAAAKGERAHPGPALSNVEVRMSVRLRCVWVVWVDAAFFPET